MAKQKFKLKLNLIDVIIFMVFLIFGAIIVLSFRAPKIESGRPTLVKIKVESQADVIYPEAKKLGETYLNSIDNPVTITNVDEKIDSSDKVSLLFITILGRGEIFPNKYIFNGARILVGQKAELHGRFFAQGIITDVSYQDQ